MLGQLDAAERLLDEYMRDQPASAYASNLMVCRLVLIYSAGFESAIPLLVLQACILYQQQCRCSRGGHRPQGGGNATKSGLQTENCFEQPVQCKAALKLLEGFHERNFMNSAVDGIKIEEGSFRGLEVVYTHNKVF
jgi:hypothetical protein